MEINPNEYLNAKRYLLSRFNAIYSDERIKKSVFILLKWIDYQDELIKKDLTLKSKIKEIFKSGDLEFDEDCNEFKYEMWYVSERIEKIKQLVESEEKNNG